MSTKTPPNISYEFNKFWKRLDPRQQISLLAGSIIAMSLILGVSVTTQQQLVLYQSQAYQPDSIIENTFNFESPSNPSPPVGLAPEQQACLGSGGSWEEFTHSCANNCAYVTNPAGVMCLQTMTYACNCGPSSCWNGQTCIESSAYLAP